MRFTTMLAACAALFAAALAAPASVQAGGFYRGDAHADWRFERPVRQHVRASRSACWDRRAHPDDCYGYRYEPRRYYPYYNSGYWRRPHEIKKRRHYALPPYYEAWGYGPRLHKPRRHFWHR